MLSTQHDRELEMTPQEEFDAFINRWGGRTRFFQLLEEFQSAPNADLGDEIGKLIAINPYAKEKITGIIQVIANGGSLDGVLPEPFQGTTHTHSASTADDFFKAKSEEYLHKAEMTYTMEEAQRSDEDGWAHDDKDIGDA